MIRRGPRNSEARQILREEGGVCPGRAIVDPMQINMEDEDPEEISIEASVCDALIGRIASYPG